MSVIVDLKNLAQEWYSKRAERKLSEPFVARRFLQESSIGSVLMHLRHFELELPKSVPFFWEDVTSHAQHEREMLRYKLRKEDMNTLSFRATDNYMDELKSFIEMARKSHEDSKKYWSAAIRQNQSLEVLVNVHNKLWSDFAETLLVFWDKEVKPYLETLILLADEPPHLFIQEKLEVCANDILESVHKKNCKNRDAFWNA